MTNFANLALLREAERVGQREKAEALLDMRQTHLTQDWERDPP